MRLRNYSLKVGNKILLDNLSISFENKVMNHLLGSNGVGKSCFAKSMVGMIPYTGIVEDIEDSPIVISSYSNVPLDFKLPDIIKILEKKFDKKRIDYFYKLLKLDSISKEIKIKKMSDGQKQKIKLLCFLMPLPKVIILDEFTSALDKKSCLEVYSFLNDFVKDNDVTCINITHNLSDVEYMPGKYYLFNDRKIQEFDSKDNIISAYVKGGV
ncbi:putative peptide transport system ATP-binding protein [Clostridium sp. DSM 8431]|uniref:ATP-binding cassette domain-containing protein n=1 Tax=Clostridium sp. DSM 8431 TaxID=1761781 RepID=UPI0008E37C55|nr:ATP-binding cassette domain-containing protein [Clostridium sp. DSM 8431]SFU85021.1 putative peptide transport system ATP-binding protein [Clostridium sp. DSM 8431]